MKINVYEKGMIIVILHNYLMCNKVTMNRIIQFIIFAFFISFLVSCSSSKPTYTYRTHKKKSKARISNVYKERVPTQYERNEVIVAAIKHIGRKYHYGGKTPKSGFDCSGFVSFSFAEAGLSAKGASFQQAKLGNKKSRASLQPGDLVFFGKGKKVNHVAIVLKNEGSVLEVIHSTSSSGVRIDDVNDSRYWNQRYLFARDIIGKSSHYASSGRE